MGGLATPYLMAGEHVLLGPEHTNVKLVVVLRPRSAAVHDYRLLDLNEVSGGTTVRRGTVRRSRLHAIDGQASHGCPSLLSGTAGSRRDPGRRLVKGE